MGKNIPCPVCGKYAFEIENDYDICGECGWENDGVQGADFSHRGGANYLSVNECKIIYELSLYNGAKEKLMVLKQDWENKHSDIHAKYRNIDWRIDGAKASHELNNAIDEYMSKIHELYRIICKR